MLMQSLITPWLVVQQIKQKVVAACAMLLEVPRRRHWRLRRIVLAVLSHGLCGLVARCPALVSVARVDWSAHHVAARLGHGCLWVILAADWRETMVFVLCLSGWEEVDDEAPDVETVREISASARFVELCRCKTYI